ncbi:MAG: hypothetical protein MUC97_02820 [Bernardetiaceae bacterium]|nr:hypothetical protein [Bernardetiaceae bacterium]
MRKLLLVILVYNRFRSRQRQANPTISPLPSGCLLMYSRMVAVAGSS